MSILEESGNQKVERERRESRQKQKITGNAKVRIAVLKSKRSLSAGRRGNRLRLTGQESNAFVQALSGQHEDILTNRVSQRVKDAVNQLSPPNLVPKLQSPRFQRLLFRVIDGSANTNMGEELLEIIEDLHVDILLDRFARNQLEGPCQNLSLDKFTTRVIHNSLRYRYKRGRGPVNSDGTPKLLFEVSHQKKKAQQKRHEGGGGE